MKKITVSAELIKIIALISMTFDHGEKILATSGILSDTIGRLAFPIFSFLIIQNFCTYHLAKKYLIRLGIFGLITSLIMRPFGADDPNVLWTFFNAILFLSAVESVCKSTTSLIWQGYWLGLLFLIQFPFILGCDYNILGFLFLLALYAYQRDQSKLNYGAVLLSGCCCSASGITPVIIVALTLIMLLSGIQIQAGRRIIKWWGFYVYYPLHKFILYCLKPFV